ncbi:APC family permease [Flexivirga caeni]|uniref:APC family permease n=1 Tax=Flexivirga caeni TaxID=2294115 RepID=A0A3M9M6L4_9MICO|nr:APC family permease [Flexivirga caeni]RNI21201.1 APC family permease [Flexivirga caeni]
MSVDTAAPVQAGELPRTVGFRGLMLISLGSIIGSGWLMAALDSSKEAGPAAIISWILCAVLFAFLALCYAELGATYPVAGGTGRFPFFSHGRVVGFLSSWSSWLQAVLIAPVEIIAAVSYLNGLHSVNKHFPMLNNQGLLNLRGILVGLAAMVVFTAINLAGGKFMSESNTIMMIWKTAIPLLAVVVVLYESHHLGNLNNAHAGGFAPDGIHGILSALPAAGVAFALQGFEQAAQLAGEAKNPGKDLSKAIIVAMVIGAGIYALLEVAFVLGVSPSDIAHGWQTPLGVANANTSSAWYTLAEAVGVTWLGTLLIADAVISPSATGVVYMGTTSRLTYNLGKEPEMPGFLSKVSPNGVPVNAIIASAIIGCIGFGPFKSWSVIVNMVTAFTAIMYGFAPIALAGLHKKDPDRARAYTMPIPKVLLPIGFISANFLIYWGGWDNTWKLMIVLVLGLILFAIGSRRAADPFDGVKNAVWVPVWLAGTAVIGYLGRYGAGTDPDHDGHLNWLPNYVDLGVVIVFSLVIFFWAVNCTRTAEQVQRAIDADLGRTDLLSE